MADAAFREELTVLVEEIKELAYERHLAQAEGTPNEPFVDPERLRDWIELRVTEHGLGQFGYFTLGDLDSFETMIHKLNNPQTGARKELADVQLEDVDLVLHNIAGWGGYAANAFRNDYVTQLKSAVNNQIVYIEELSRILACYHDILSTARDDIRTIANNTKDALEALPEGGGGSGLGVFTVVAVVGTVVGLGGFGIPPAVVAAVETAGTAAGVADTLFNGMGNAAPAPLERNEKPHFRVSGLTIFEVFDSMDERIQELIAHMRNEEQYIDQGLTSDIGYFDTPGDVDQLLPDRPNSADVNELPNAEDFDHPEHVEDVLRGRPAIADFPGTWHPDDNPGDFEPTGGLTLDNISKLYAAGEVMSAMAYRYHKALGHVYTASGRENSAFDGLFGQTNGKWTTARDMLRYILLQTKDNLIDAADALHRIAQAYAEAEGVNQEQLEAAVDVQLAENDRTTMEEYQESVYAPPSLVS